MSFRFMPSRRSLLSLFAALAVLVHLAPAGLTSAQAAEATQPYTPAAFAAAQKAGKSILVKITAPWCSTCKAQRPILDELTAAPKFRDLAVFEIDFDTQKDAVAAMRATMQATLITFKGESETGRLVYDTRKPAISALLDKAI
jgi:thioredoxin 1